MTDLTPIDRDLAAAIAAWLAESMASDLGDALPGDDGTLHDLGQSTYEVSCAVLAALGVYERVQQCVWRPVVAIEDVADHVASLTLDRLLFEQLIDAFVIHGVGFSGIFQEGTTIRADRRPDRREKVVLRLDGMTNRAHRHLDRRELVIIRLHVAGFLTAMTEGFAWAYRGCPWLVYHCLWDLDRVPPVSAEDASEVAARLPLRATDLLRRTGDSCHFLGVFISGWSGTGWREELNGPEVPSESWDMPLAAGLHRHIHPDRYV